MEPKKPQPRKLKPKPIHKYVLQVRSKPGPWSPHNGTVEVTATDDTLAIDEAFRKLRLLFPERFKTQWTITKLERIMT